MIFNHQKIEKRWREIWEKKKIYEAKNFAKKPKFYGLIEFPYPSGDGLHVGHIRSYTAMDIIARKRQMEGWNVLYPIGWDAFGLPTENYAIKTGVHPKIVTKKNTGTFRRQLKSMGFSFDWSREINTTDPNYYKWTQWIFLQFFKHGLAYKKKMPINWCPRCKIGLANEEVVAGKCERCGNPAEQREKEQWLLAITKYAERLLKDLDKVDYLPKIKIQQRNWIGKSEGALIKFPISNFQFPIKVFTTRPDTIFGATFMVLAPEHPLVASLLAADSRGLNADLRGILENKNEVKKYIQGANKKSDAERTDTGKEKTGVELKGIKAINPATKKEIPVFVADYVSISYGTGAIMGVPAHDERDLEFAKKFKLPIRPVILKSSENSLSFVMGFKEEDLRGLGITIVEKTKSGFFKIEVPFKKLEEYKILVRKRMRPHYWNEFSTPTGFYFIFKHRDGRIEEFELNEETNDAIDRYGMSFNDEKPKSTPENVYSWLAQNDFYKNILIHTDNGILVNSGKFTGIDSETAKWEITKFVGGKKQVQYHLRDWIFSRQRYWGEPIPLIFCSACKKLAAQTNADHTRNDADNVPRKSALSQRKSALSKGEELNPGWIAVSEKDLPVKLPDVKNYKPTDTGESPLAAIKNWVNVKCPKCNGPARRETDTMPNWAGSSWYYLAYIMQGISNFQFPISNYRKALKYWAPVDWYNGGMEHTTLHLLYSRFWNKFLYDIGAAPTSEPYQKRTSHGMILGEGGEKMSKSKGNVVNPDYLVGKFGADTLRLYEMFMGPFGQAIAWDHRGLNGVRRFLGKIWDIFQNKNISAQVENADLAKLLHRTIKKVGEDIESMSFNTAVSSLMIFVNKCYDVKDIPKDIWEKFLLILAPFAPFIAEELYQQLKTKNSKLKTIQSIHEQKWPKYNPKLIQEDNFELVIQVNGKVRDKASAHINIKEKEAKEVALNREKVKNLIGRQKIRKIIFVSGRLINIVIN